MLSKIHEDSTRGTLDEVIAHFEAVEPRGEIVIILAGADDEKNVKVRNASKNKYKKQDIEDEEEDTE